MARVDEVILVYSNWCPHCNPPALDAMKIMEKDLGAAVSLLDIDNRESEKKADEIVKKHGDWVEDYLIPQIFFKSNGNIKHVFTGYSENVEITKEKLNTLISGKWYKSLATKP